MQTFTDLIKQAGFRFPAITIIVWTMWTEKKCIYDLGNHQWDIPKLRKLLEDILPKNTQMNDFEVTHDFPDIGKKTMLLNARKIYLEGKGTDLILLAIEDRTGK